MTVAVVALGGGPLVLLCNLAGTAPRRYRTVVLAGIASSVVAGLLILAVPVAFSALIRLQVALFGGIVGAVFAFALAMTAPPVRMADG